MSELNLEEISALFHIHEKAGAYGTNFSAIRDAAWTRLQKINAEHMPAVVSTYVPTALDKELAGTAAAEPPPTADPQPDTMRRL